MPTNNRNRLREATILGICSILAAAAGALVANWDELFGQPGRRPSNSIETETRYYLDITGQRKAFELAAQASTKIVSDAVKCQFQHFDSRLTLWNQISTTIESNRLTADEIATALLPVYTSHLTLSQVQAANKAYSSGLLKDLTEKREEIAKESVLRIKELQAAVLNRIAKALNEQTGVPSGIRNTFQTIADTHARLVAGLCP